MLWFVGDLHFQHSNIIKYCNRPFSSIEEHDQVLLENWNKCIQKGDTCYCLGDIGGFRRDDYPVYKILQQLKSNIVLILGNHDSTLTERCKQRFGTIKDVHMLKTKVNDRKIELWLSHYSHRSWPKMNYGSIHLFAHSHSNLPPFGKSFDVGVDNAYKLLGEYRPFSLEEVVQIADSLPLHFDYSKKEEKLP